MAIALEFILLGIALLLCLLGFWTAVYEVLDRRRVRRVQRNVRNTNVVDLRRRQLSNLIVTGGPSVRVIRPLPIVPPDGQEKDQLSD